MNAAIRQFEQGMIQYINDSQLPLEVKRLVLIEVLQQTTEEATKVVIAEMNNKNEERSNEA